MKLFFNILFTSIIVFVSTGYAASCNNEADRIIKLYDLKPLEFEGGYFKQTYLLKNDNLNESPKATAIFFLLKKGQKSLIHKVSSDEIYHFYAGDPLVLLQFKDDGSSKKIILGKDILKGQQVQVIIPKNTWMGSFVADGGCYSLIGTTMTPGFDRSEFELGKREDLIKKFPKDKDIITHLTTD